MVVHASRVDTPSVLVTISPGFDCSVVSVVHLRSLPVLVDLG